MVTYRLFISNEEIHNATLPLRYGKFLDEQLDHATVGLTRIKFIGGEKCFTPTTPVKIVIASKIEANGILYDQSKTLYYILAQDNFKESPIGTGEFRHELTLIEPTKLLEGIPVESLCFTNAGGKDYSKVSPSITTIVINE